MRNDLTPFAQFGYMGNANPNLNTSPAWYAHAMGQYLHDSGRNPPSGVRMGRGDSIHANGMLFKIIHDRPKSVSFDRII